MSVSHENSGSPTAEQKFRALVQRSINDWESLIYVAPEAVGVTKRMAINISAKALRDLKSVEEFLESREFYCFQRRESFMNQTTFKKWNLDSPDDYILIPRMYGLINNRQFFFVSHYWRTPEHPDPEGQDLRKIREDIAGASWDYIWVDWTCLPQAPRNEREQKFFTRMVRNVPALIRDCGFQWRYPRFRPRAWVLYEVSDFLYHHDFFFATRDVAKTHSHAVEMLDLGVREVIAKYGYECSVPSDLELVISWMEIMIILCKVTNDISRRQQIFEMINRANANILILTEEDLKLTIDKDQGIIAHHGKRYSYTPLPPYHLS